MTKNGVDNLYCLKGSTDRAAPVVVVSNSGIALSTPSSLARRTRAIASSDSCGSWPSLAERELSVYTTSATALFMGANDGRFWAMQKVAVELRAAEPRVVYHAGPMFIIEQSEPCVDIIVITEFLSMRVKCVPRHLGTLRDLED
ncbi:hypothetical protein N7448_008921 [Penicillium atrosanguineum]|uniref:Uncharacterized protein n=1 Tax=Penicillium atrosanguineum TaxID=1132637 RepID=A0A9W9UBA1_9EURO|nr:Formyltetrahydrofolate deformylase [Penicillium atrosanguineum]KAJ5128142.1 hypothetical protein N7448_008921 [Penicillium atrosanguineum]KAJ5313167.1 Formyltetrahydrofolate deformylase [Penicillium atrosanguineum]KAJ5330272.1 hypothetical protein N7476_000055 [Penicillium atrosanguineum]